MVRFFKKEKMRKSYFYGIFRLYLLFLLPIILISIFSYLYIKKSLMEEANNHNTNNIYAIASKIQTDFYEMERLSYLVVKAMQHENVKSFSVNYDEETARNLYELENLRSMLTSLKSAKENIYRIFIHFPKSALLVADDGIYDFNEYYRMFPNRTSDIDIWNQIGGIDYLKVFATLKLDKNRNSRIKSTANDDINVIPLVISYRKFEGINAYLVMNIQEKYIAGLLRNSVYSKDTQTFILDAEGNVISHTDGGQLYQPVYRDLAKKDLHAGNGREIEFRNEKYVAYSQKVGFPNWTVYTLVPERDFYNELHFMSKLLVIINLLILCTGVIAAYFFSNRLYSPIRNLMNILYGYSGKNTKKANFDEIEFIKDHLQILKDAKNTLEIKLNKMTPVINENIVKNIILYGDSSISEKEIASLFHEYDIRMKGRNFLLGVCRLYYSRAFTVDFPIEDQKVIHKKIPYTIGKILETRCEQAMFMELEDGRYLIVLSSDEENVKEQFCRVFDEINKLLKEDWRYIKMRLSVSEPASSILSLAESFKNVQARLDFANLKDNRFLVEKLTMDPNKELLWPPNFEESLINAISGGRDIEMKSLIDHVFHMNLKDSLTPFKFERIIHRLFDYVEETIRTLNCSIPLDNYKNDSVFKQYDIEGAKLVFMKVWREITVDLKQEPHADKKNKMGDYIEKRYINENLSLQTMADELGFNTNYLSRLFKEQTGRTFTDYLSEIRIAKAKELILNTDYVMDEVANSIGISNRRTFNRTFKKITGVSPAMYRIIKS